MRNSWAVRRYRGFRLLEAVTLTLIVNFLVMIYLRVHFLLDKSRFLTILGLEECSNDNNILVANFCGAFQNLNL